MFVYPIPTAESHVILVGLPEKGQPHLVTLTAVEMQR